MTSDDTTPDPAHSVPRVTFGSDAAEPEQESEESTQNEAQRELQEENAETSLDQPST